MTVFGFRTWLYIASSISYELILCKLFKLLLHLMLILSLSVLQGSLEYVKLVTKPQGYLEQCPYADVGKKLNLVESSASQLTHVRP